MKKNSENLANLFWGLIVGLTIFVWGVCLAWWIGAGRYLEVAQLGNQRLFAFSNRYSLATGLLAAEDSLDGYLYFGTNADLERFRTEMASVEAICTGKLGIDRHSETPKDLCSFSGQWETSVARPLIAKRIALDAGKVSRGEFERWYSASNPEVWKRQVRVGLTPNLDTVLQSYVTETKSNLSREIGYSRLRAIILAAASLPALIIATAKLYQARRVRADQMTASASSTE